MLNKQAGIISFAPLKPYFTAISRISHAYLSGVTLLPSIPTPINRTWGEDANTWLPAALYTSEVLINKLQQAYPVMTRGKYFFSKYSFAEATNLFREIIHQAVLTVAKSQSEAAEVLQLIEVCKQYLLGLAIENARRELGPDDAKRGVELAAYFTHCNLQSVHLQLAIRLAMVQAFKLKNYGTAASFATRLLELGPAPAVAQSVSLY